MARKALAPIIGRETSVSYRWVGPISDPTLLRTRTTLAWRQEAVQFVESERSSEVYTTDADYAEGLVYANDLAYADAEAYMEGR